MCKMPSFLGTSRDIMVIGLILILLAVPSSCQTQSPLPPPDLICSPQCTNGGSCVEGKCICLKAFTGSQCEIPMEKYLGIDHIWLSGVKKILQNFVGTKGIRPGRDFSLPCPPNYNVNRKDIGSYTTQWTLNDTLLDPAKDSRVTIDPSTGRLSISTPVEYQSRYEGVYQCRISNDFGTALGSRSQVKLKVTGSFINNLPITYNVTLNNKLAIRCPEHTYSHGMFYRWINSTNNEEVNFPKPRVMTSQEDGTLYFTHVTGDDVADASNGIQCRISMGGEEISPMAYSGLVKLKKVRDDGAFETTFFKTPPSTTVYLAADATREFHCFPSGRSPVTLIWLKDSTPVISNNIIRLYNYNRTLRINTADRSVEGKYSYKTQNPDGTRTESGMTIRVIEPTTAKYFFNQKETITLDCMNIAQPLNYPAVWYYNGVTVSSLINSVFLDRASFHPNGSFTIKSAEPRDSGVFQCFVDGITASHHYVYVIGAPLPPVSLNTTDCSKFTTTLSWNIKPEPKIPVSSFIIEIGNTYEPNVFKQVKEVKDPNARRVGIEELSPWANILFRMKAINSLGSSLPSRLSNPCITLSSKPTSIPETLKAVPLKISGGINVTWKSFPKIQWNGNKCVIRVYHKLHNISTWTLSPKNTLCSSTTIDVDKLGNYQLINIKIQVQNEIGMGPNSSVVTAYSGQNPPREAPKNFRVVSVTPYSVTLTWDELLIQGGSVDEYVVTYRLPQQSARKKRSLDHPEPNHDSRRSSMRSRRSLEHPDPNHDSRRSSMRSRRSLDYPEPNHDSRRSSMRSRRSLEHPEPNHDSRRSSMRSRRLALHQMRDSRSARHLCCKESLNSNFREISAKDKRRLFLAKIMSSFPGAKHKAKRILRRIRRVVLIPQGDPLFLRVKVSNATVHGLLPFTSYLFFVRGVNSGGLGPSTEITQKTLDSVDSSYIITMVVTSETFTSEYEDKTSLKFRNLSDTLTTGIRRQFQQVKRHFWIRSLDLLLFSNGSVVSELQMVAANPDRLEFERPLRGEIMKNYFPNYIIDPSKTSIEKELNFTRPNISVSNTSPYPGVTIEFECLATRGPRSPVFSWFKDGIPVVFDVRHKFSLDDTKSILTIRKLSSVDRGNYMCVVSKGNQNASSSVFLNVLPVITITPMTLTKNEGDSATFSCKVLSGNIIGMDLVIINPYISPAKEVGRNSVTVKELRISSNNLIEVFYYQCILVKNNDLDNPVSKSPLAKLTVVKPSSSRCRTEIKDRVTWLTTAAGETDIQPCPGNATGQTTRRCILDQDSKPRWDDVNVGNCTSIIFQNLLLEAEAIVSDYKSSLNSSALLEELKHITTTSPSEQIRLNGGDLDITARILSILVNDSKIDNTIDNDQQNFMEICSNIWEPANAKPWIQFEDQRRKNTSTLWKRLVMTVDEYGLQLTNYITLDKNKVLTTKNIVMQVDKVGLQNKIKKQGLKFQHEQSSIFLPAEIFSGDTPDHRVVSLVYKTLNLVMRLRNTANETQAGNENDLVTPNTTMVTSTVRPEPTGKLRSYVKIVVENKKVVDPVPPRTCVFWRDGLPSMWNTDGCSLVTSESTKHVTTCKCDHLTIFASLMDPYGGPLPLEHRKALELISTIGCAISLFAILLTIAVMAFFWKALKGPRTIVLMNICVAIAVVCILVIAEGTARETKDGCTVMAVLLHYFLLAVFCWMLCEGILLYFLIVKVIGAKVEEKVKWFLIFGWGFPAVIVGISLGATQTHGYGYYGNETACWLAVDNGLIWAFVAPAIVILLINFIVLVLVIRQMMGTRHVQSKPLDIKVRMGVKATAILLPLLGITWLFGLLAFSSATLAFKYLFAILNSLQGLMIFILHCVLNKQVQDAVKRKYQKYSSTDSTSSGTRGKNLRPKKKKEKPAKRSSDFSGAKISQNDYEMNPQKRHSVIELIAENEPGPSKIAATDKITLDEVNETQVHKPKEDISSVDEDSSDESSYCKINDAYENQSDVEHMYEERPIKSNIGSPNCVGDVENSFKVSSGLFNKGLEEDEDKTAEKPSDDQDENEKDSASDSDEDQCSLVVNTNEDQPTFNDEQGSPPSPLSTYNEAKENEKDSASDSDEDQCSLVVNASVSPSLSFSSDFDVKFKPIGIENPNEYQPTFNEKQGSSPLCTYNEAEDNPLPFDNPFLIEEEENDLNKPCSKLNDDDNDTIGTPPSTPSSFDFGLPLNVWSTDSQKSSPSLPKKDPEEDKDSDDTANGSSSSNKDKESGINSDNSESESAQPDPNTDAHVEDSELNENDDVCESGSDVSSENSEKFMEYDLLDIDVEELEKEGENNVAFKRFKKRDSFII